MIELIVLDVDGTMTNGQITYTNSEDEIKSFCVKDGLAIASWLKLGKYAAIITGRESKIVANRAKELKIPFFYQNIKQKDKAVEEILQKLQLSWDDVAAIGDDINDYTMLQKAAISYTPQNGSHFLDKVVTKRLSKKGGEGAVREMIEDILQTQGLIKEFLALWNAN